MRFEELSIVCLAYMPDQVHMKYKHCGFLLFEPVVFLDGNIANPYLGERETIRFHILIMLRYVARTL